MTLTVAGGKLWWADEESAQLGTVTKRDGRNPLVLRNKTSGVVHMKVYDREGQKGVPARAHQPTLAHSQKKKKKKMLQVNHPLTLRTPHHSPAAAGSASASRSGRNPCQVNNGGCSQLCFPTSENSRSCSCTVGYNLRSDRMSCEGTRCNCVSVFTQHAFVILHNLCQPVCPF